MTDQEILSKAIEKAEANGYDIDKNYLNEPSLTELTKSFNIYEQYLDSTH